MIDGPVHKEEMNMSAGCKHTDDRGINILQRDIIIFISWDENERSNLTIQGKALWLCKGSLFAEEQTKSFLHQAFNGLVHTPVALQRAILPLQQRRLWWICSSLIPVIPQMDPGAQGRMDVLLAHDQAASQQDGTWLSAPLCPQPCTCPVFLHTRVHNRPAMDSQGR